jgi:hypothetical protein
VAGDLDCGCGTSCDAEIRERFEIVAPLRNASSPAPAAPAFRDPRRERPPRGEARLRWTAPRSNVRNCERLACLLESRVALMQVSGSGDGAAWQIKGA